jgi:putative redox protein
MTTAKVTLNPMDYEMTAVIGGHTLILDEPVSSGGQNKGPSPTQCLSVSLAACTVATLKMYMNRKQLKPESLKVEVTKESDESGNVLFKTKIFLKGNFDAAQRERILMIADKCPVHKILEKGNIIETTYSD